MSSVMGLVDAHAERKGFFVLTFGAKIAYCAAFVFIRADESLKERRDEERDRTRRKALSSLGVKPGACPWKLSDFADQWQGRLKTND